MTKNTKFVVTRFLFCKLKFTKMHLQQSPGPGWGSLRCSLRPPSRLGRGYPLPIPLPATNSLGAAAYSASILMPPSTQNPGYAAGCRLSCSNRGPVALCTLGLGLLNPPSFRGQ